MWAVGGRRTGRYASYGYCASCPVGTYSLANAASCTACGGGRYGSSPRLGSPSCSGVCSAGYYCPPGSVSATQSVCPPGQYSTQAATGCTACSPGQYAAAPGAAGCDPCAAGTLQCAVVGVLAFRRCKLHTPSPSKSMCSLDGDGDSNDACTGVVLRDHPLWLRCVFVAAVICGFEQGFIRPIRDVTLVARCRAPRAGTARRVRQRRRCVRLATTATPLRCSLRAARLCVRQGRTAPLAAPSRLRVHQVSARSLLSLWGLNLCTWGLHLLYEAVVEACISVRAKLLKESHHHYTCLLEMGCA